MQKNSMTHLHTALGVRTLENSVAYCNRCGMCMSSCPTYQITRQEAFSPRGRNQALRLLLEEKFHPRHQRDKLVPLVLSCMLCGKCTQNCPGQIPTAQHMLEMRRRLKISLLPKGLICLYRLRAGNPRLFGGLMRAAHLLHVSGLLRWGNHLPGLSFLQEAGNYFPSHFQKTFKPAACSRPTLFYLPSVEAEYICPQEARRVYQLAEKKHRVRVWQRTPSGLFEYVYGDVRRARIQVRRLITQHAKQGEKIPILTDSADVYQFLKNAPQLFEGFPRWEEKAMGFAKSVCYVSKLLAKKPRGIPRFDTPVTWMPAVLLNTQPDPLQQTGEILHTLFKKNFVKCEYRDAALSTAGYGLYNRPLDETNNLQVARYLAAHQIQTVFVPSILVKQKLQTQLNRFYPKARVCYLLELNG